MDFLTFDIETTYGKSNGRVGNLWDEAFGLCSVGWKFGKGEYDDAYTVSVVEGRRLGTRHGNRFPFPSLHECSYLVGHNI